MIHAIFPINNIIVKKLFFGIYLFFIQAYKPKVKSKILLLIAPMLMLRMKQIGM
ncbi:hypothetical protein PI23P_11997 [Polaribacter irgensii 23-P]|uniref:Uncharacterized protein n=1 Tax=Polaribacter irgensii 23-P TaxID=313594 RepID=A4C1Q2_9FLAO|nr:hypothetical protein PI23P_11997 [Polaribacter irgensii 23-P]